MLSLTPSQRFRHHQFNSPLLVAVSVFCWSRALRMRGQAVKHGAQCGEELLPVWRHIYVKCKIYATGSRGKMTAVLVTLLGTLHRPLPLTDCPRALDLITCLFSYPHPFSLPPPPAPTPIFLLHLLTVAVDWTTCFRPNLVDLLLIFAWSFASLFGWKTAWLTG